MPVASTLGFDLVWLGVLFCMNMQISYVSPPFGPAAFYLKGVVPPDITLGDIFRSIWPYLGLQVIALGLVIAFPQIALWLPSTMDEVASMERRLDEVVDVMRVPAIGRSRASRCCAVGSEPPRARRSSATSSSPAAAWAASPPRSRRRGAAAAPACSRRPTGSAAS